MAPKGMKRPAASPAAGPSPKGGRNPAQAKINAVKAALGEASQLPDAVQTLLVSAVQDTLGVKKEDRHDIQAQCVAMIGDALDGLVAMRQATVDELQGKVDGADGELSTLMAGKASAETAVEDASNKLEAAKAALGADCKAVEAAADAVGKAKEAEKESDVTLGKASEVKGWCEETQPQVAQLKVQEEAADSKTISSILTGCKRHGFDESLLGMLPACLKKPKGQRGTFDTMAFESFEGELSKCLEGAVKRLAELEAGKAQYAAYIEAAVAAQGAAETKRDAAATAKDEAAEALKKAKAAVAASKEQVAASEKGKKTNTKDLSAAQGKLSDLQAGALAAFKELRDPPAPAPPVEPAPAVDPEPAAEPVAEPQPVAVVA